VTTQTRIITLIDYGAGNVTSVERALHKLGAETIRANTPAQIDQATALILPGVGHFATLIRALDEHNLRAPLLAALNRGIPFLGICLGLQALYDGSDEAPELKGLALVPGQVVALPTNVKLPHMGWNQLQIQPRATPSSLLRGVSSDAHFYFAHSFAALPTQQKAGTVATCTHGSEFIAVFERNNIHAVQFHPEKSGAPGAQLLANFVGMTEAAI
jgi:imidazole glycerol phosphate synthase glutamine amidotransferase subunit